MRESDQNRPKQIKSQTFNNFLATIVTPDVTNGTVYMNVLFMMEMLWYAQSKCKYVNVKLKPLSFCLQHQVTGSAGPAGAGGS